MKKPSLKIFATLTAVSLIGSIIGLAGCAQAPQEPPVPTLSPAIAGVQAKAPVGVKSADGQVMLRQDIDRGHYNDGYSMSWLRQSLSGTGVGIDRVKYSNGFHWVTGVRLRMPVHGLLNRGTLSNETLEYRVGIDLMQMPGYIYLVPGDGVGHHEMDRIAQAFRGSGVTDGRMVFGRGIAPNGTVDIYIQDEPAR